jgi:hypothetical protein
MKATMARSPALAIKTAGPRRVVILMCLLTVGTTIATASENPFAPADQVATREKSASHNDDGCRPDAGLLLYDDIKTADPMQQRLSSMLAKNGATEDGHRQPAAPEAAAGRAGTGESGAPHKWQTVLPILGEEAEAKGHTLPRAFGLMPAFYHGRRHIGVSDSQVTIKRITIPADRLTDIKVKSRELNWSMRLDAWLFPFLNIYGLLGYTREDAYAGIAVTPLNRLRTLLGKKPRDLVDLHLDLTGATYGAGFTLVGGYKKFFASYDSNYTISALRGDLPFDNTLSPDVKALLNSIRVGWRTQLAGYNLACWLGGTYWDTTNTIKGTPRVPVIGPVKFRVREKTKDPWSAHIGTNVEVSESFQLVLDMGSNFSGLFAIAPTLMYRF